MTVTRCLKVLNSISLLAYNWSLCFLLTQVKRMHTSTLFGTSMSTFAPFFNPLVWPHFEYATQACSPNLAAETNCLEQIQRLATRLVKGFRRLPYKERLRRLGLHSSHRRRLHWDLKAVYKMFSAGLGLGPSLLLIPPVWTGLRGYPLNVLQGAYRRLRRNSFSSIRVVKYCNRLPTPIVTALFVNSFKVQGDSAWEELLAEVPWFPSFYFHVILFPAPPSPPQMTQSHITLSPFMLSQPQIHSHPKAP